jgi:hypothetical protein
MAAPNAPRLPNLSVLVVEKPPAERPETAGAAWPTLEPMVV